MLAPGKGIHVIKRSGTFPGQDMKRTIGTPAGSGEVIDWDGPDPDGAQPRDWSGWGKFPGARYLGIQDEKKKTALQRDDMGKDSDNRKNPAAADAAAPPTLVPDHEAMKVDQHHASEQPMPPADK
jgi:hypothetical protein